MRNEDGEETVEDEERWKSIDWDIRAEGRAMTVEEFETRLWGGPEKMELIDGKVFWDDDQRMIMLGMVLESLGIDKAVRIGDPELWRRAIDKLDEDEGG